MTVSADVCALAEFPGFPISTDGDFFELQSPLGGNDALLIFDFPRDVMDDPIVSSDLPAAVSRQNDDPRYNLTTNTDNRNTHLVMIGNNTGSDGEVNRHSIMGCTVYNDDGLPHLFVWDWQNDKMHGPLFPESAVKMMQGPIFIFPFIYFITIDAGDLKLRLWRTNPNLLSPDPSEDGIGAVEVGSASSAIPLGRSIEHMIASGEYIGILVSPAGGPGAAYTEAWSWNHEAPGPANELTTLVGVSVFSNNQRRNQPGVKLITADSFYNPDATPAKNDLVNATNYERSTMFNVGLDWGSDFIGSGFSFKAFTVFGNETKVIYTYDGTEPPPSFLYGIRTWRTGTVIVADQPFIVKSQLTAGYEVAYVFPFEPATG